ncbi:DNA-directed RNA polymerase I subunit RPA2 isoform X1 [Schistocerca piceifrons]|uniref:DNA-directed RNA polymerase I subunit RPA2 isoform X1 n=1 Tax=Schistocerca piceifrons TaxID=274613 RepID=UPI001F5F9083|nr:DNA-directed RNA polymerase I subunit RPA2 isoform X1 [Schistocerca piceifrons]
MAVPSLNSVTQPTLKNLTSGFGELPEKQNEFLQSLGAPHVESFNFMLDRGLNKALEDMDETQFALPNDDRVSLKLVDIQILPPLVPQGVVGAKSLEVFPTECRQRGDTYRGRMIGRVICSVAGKPSIESDVYFGDIPIMIKSDRCHLARLSPKELISRGEHAEEWGGYFVVKGHERLIRMLLMTRRNYPLTVARTGWKQRGVQFSDLGVMIRCVADDETATNNVLHYVTDGTAKLMFSARKNLYYAPVVLILKSLLDVTDEYIYQQLIKGYEDDLYYKGCIKKMLLSVHEEGYHTHSEVRDYIGSTFRVKMYEVPPWGTNADVCDHILKKYIAIHVSSFVDKFNILVLMTQKLFSAVADRCCIEGGDSLMTQELLLGGHLYLQVLKDRFQSWLSGLKMNILKKAESTPGFMLKLPELQLAIKKTGKLESSLTSFISTGNLRTQSGLGLMQDKGLTIMAENINRMRYMSHFRAVHRGSFFQEMRTTEVRQLLPDAWGFICPAHTPDGTPCGLLNHLTKDCVVTQAADPQLVSQIPSILVSLGMLPLGSITLCSYNQSQCFVVVLDGRVLGYVPKDAAPSLVQQLRLMKAHGVKVPRTLEIGFIPGKFAKGQYPGLFLFTGPARMMRPVINLSTNTLELIGTLEQVYLDICVRPEEAYPGVTTHQEVSTTSFLSNLACLIPMPDCNQSPRNMYQCQMGKQTMGTPCHTWHLQSETKLYRLQTPSSPLFRPVHHDIIGLDEFAMGTNAIVAVISYTGYDMEDAMIINKSSYERGLCHGSIYKSDFIELPTQNCYFELDPNLIGQSTSLDSDGLPMPGTVLDEGNYLYCYYDAEEATYRTGKWKGSERAYIDNVRLCGAVGSSKNKACITFRIRRDPSIGDKFASRAGQKGICSQLWPTEDLPFTETGMVPDIVFNPHGFPSRMTIAMMIEVMAGKSAAIHGLVHDATPFKFSEKQTAIEYFGSMLEAGGYNYYGTETMYSGVDGRELTAKIFFGIVHYQRLRHMVSDKWQVRSTGPIDVLTHQPVKGRRRGGGIRFGEMERDSLLSHGASFLLQDRLFHCSDKTKTLICKKCGNILSPLYILNRKQDHHESVIQCRMCKDSSAVQEIEIPYIYRYLVAQLASVNINLKLDVTEE